MSLLTDLSRFLPGTGSEEHSTEESGNPDSEPSTEPASEDADGDERGEPMVLLGTATETEDTGHEPSDRSHDPEPDTSDMTTQQDDTEQPEPSSPDTTGETPVSTQSEDQDRATDNPDQIQTLRTSQETGQDAQRNGDRRRNDPGELFMELPDTCVTETENPDTDAPVEKMLPEVLPGWNLQKTDSYRWRVPEAEDWITATYVDPVGNRYMIHVSRWQPEHVRYVIDELYGLGKPARFDAWTARGRFVFAVKTDGGTIERAKTLLAACPPLSKSYLER